MTVEEIRKSFLAGDTRRDKGLTTPEDIIRCDNIPYGEHGVWNLTDVYYPKTTTSCQKTIISIHGGAWVYGTKEQYQFYCMNLAQRGFTVVNFNYRLAPEHKYPTALEDVNQLFVWLRLHYEEYFVDLNQLYIVGDSAGAQLASQYLIMLNNKEYATTFSFPIESEIKIKAAALNCGAYDILKIMEISEDEGIFSYIGDTDPKTLDVLQYLNDQFPPTILTTATHDFLKEMAKPMYERLRMANVPCKMKVYEGIDGRELCHVFHLNIRSEEAKICNDEECEFFDSIQ